MLLRFSCPHARTLHSKRPAFESDFAIVHLPCRDGWVAQLAEQRTENPRVGGSIPPPASVCFAITRYSLAIEPFYKAINHSEQAAESAIKLASWT